MLKRFTRDHSSIIILMFVCCLSWVKTSAYEGGNVQKDEFPSLDNPVSVSYLKKNLRKEYPRLILTPALEKQLKRKLKSDPVIQNVYAAIKLNANEILKQPRLTRKVVGRRLLHTSREMLYRMNILGMVYRIDKDKKILERIDQELQAVCNFIDWNPSHFLDVAEMSMAVAIAVDWTAGDLPDATIRLAKNALIEKGINPSFNMKQNVGWIDAHHNWNQVCHGGMIAAALTIAEEDWELAAKTIHRALEKIPHALKEYSPDGVYPEGATYWSYGTGFSVVTSSMLTSALETDFGIANYPAFTESAVFKVLSVAPTGYYYNFADCGDKRGGNGDFVLAWFAAKTRKSAFYEKERFLQSPNDMGTLSRHAGAGLVWLSQIEEAVDQQLPTAWKGEGENPIAIFRDESTGFYLGCKGGRATTNHGNMDAGSFVFELDGVRWIIDPGNQGYHDLERIGFDLWSRCQHCERWTLLTKNNFGHSTFTVNNELFVNDGFVPVIDFKPGERPEVTFDMKNLYGDNIASATRRFMKESSRSVLIEDKFAPNDATKVVTWQLMTTAEVELFKGGARLITNGKSVYLDILSHPGHSFSVISLDPPPLEPDRRIAGLKRLELTLPGYMLTKDGHEISVRISGEKR